MKKMTPERAKQLAMTCHTDSSFLAEYLPPSNEVNNASGEEGIHISIVQWLSKVTTDGLLKAVWYHVPNQWDGQVNNIFGARMRRQGKLNGVADLSFAWETGSGFIEVKQPKTGRLSPFQMLFKEWCALTKVFYEVVYSVEDTKDTLVKWGLLPVDRC